jgi:hypothetical protein
MALNPMAARPPRWGPRRLRRLALLAWVVFAFVTWNVVFDRQVYIAAVHFTQQQIERYQQGQPVSSIAAAFSPRVGDAAVHASLWGGSLLAAGLLLTFLAGRYGGKS